MPFASDPKVKTVFIFDPEGGDGDILENGNPFRTTDLESHARCVRHSHCRECEREAGVVPEDPVSVHGPRN